MFEWEMEKQVRKSERPCSAVICVNTAVMTVSAYTTCKTTAYTCFRHLGIAAQLLRLAMQMQDRKLLVFSVESRQNRAKLPFVTVRSVHCLLQAAFQTEISTRRVRLHRRVQL